VEASLSKRRVNIFLINKGVIIYAILVLLLHIVVLIYNFCINMGIFYNVFYESFDFLIKNTIEEGVCFEKFYVAVIIDEVWILHVGLSSVTYDHIFRERNLLEDALSKECLGFAHGEWVVLAN
jgi:hypothetical protein